MHYSSIELRMILLTPWLQHAFFTSASSYVWLHEFSLWNFPGSCLLNTLSASGCIMISADWSINFQIFFSTWSWVCLFRICQIHNRVACWDVRFSLSCLKLRAIWAWAALASCLICDHFRIPTLSNCSCLYKNVCTAITAKEIIHFFVSLNFGRTCKGVSIRRTYQENFRKIFSILEYSQTCL